MVSRNIQTFRAKKKKKIFLEGQKYFNKKEKRSREDLKDLHSKRLTIGSSQSGSFMKIIVIVLNSSELFFFSFFEFCFHFFYFS